MHGNVSFLELGSVDAEKIAPVLRARIRLELQSHEPRRRMVSSACHARRIAWQRPATADLCVSEVPELEQAMALVREAGGEADPPTSEPGFGNSELP